MDISPVSIPKTIVSASNSEVKLLRSLHERKYRKKTGWFLAEGARICQEAVELGWNMHRLAFIGGSEKQPLTKSLLSGLVLSNGRALPMTEPLLSRISRRDNAQKFLAAFSQRWKELSSISLSTKDTWLALDRIRDPGNLGTIMRTADATGVTGIILIGDCTDPFSVESVRASMGAVFNVDLINCSEMMFLNFVKKSQYNLIGTSVSANLTHKGEKYSRPLIVLMGNEQSGLSTNLLKECNQLIKIPMLGRSDSLNLAVATGVVLYEMVYSHNE